MRLEVKVALISGAAGRVEAERTGRDAPLNAREHTYNAQLLSYKDGLPEDG